MGHALTMTYEEALNPGLALPNDSFVVSGGHAVAAATVTGSTVSLTLSPAVVAGETITLSYTPGALGDRGCRWQRRRRAERRARHE